MTITNQPDQQPQPQVTEAQEPQLFFNPDEQPATLEFGVATPEAPSAEGTTVGSSSAEIETTVLSNQPVNEVLVTAPEDPAQRPKKIRFSLGQKVGAAIGIGVLGAGAAVFASRGGDDKINAEKPRSNDRFPTSVAGAGEEKASAPEAPPSPVIPNSPDNATLLSQIFTNINYGYRTGDVSYLNYALLGNESIGQQGSETPLGKILGADIQKATEKARQHRTIFKEDTEAPKHIETKLLVSDNSSTLEKKFLVELIEVDTLGKEADVRSAPRYWILFISEKGSMKAQLIGGVQELPNKTVSDQIAQNPLLLKNYHL